MVKIYDFSKSKDKITKEDIFKKFNDEDIFRHYLGPKFKIGGAIKSPIRPSDDKDDSPSFSVYRSTNGRLRFKDHAYPDLRGDCIALVCLLHRVSFMDALRIINRDLSVKTVDSSKPTEPTQTLGAGQGRDIISLSRRLEESTIYPIRIEQQPYTFADITKWYMWGVSIETLAKFDILSCKHVYYGVNELSANYTSINPIYAYRDQNAERIRYMIYRPCALKEDKFRMNLERHCVFGLKQLPEKGELLIITKSMKDVASLHDLGYTAVAARSESETIIPSIIHNLKERFKLIVTNLDPDQAGIHLRETYSLNHGFPSFSFPQPQKDCSGYVFSFNQTEAKQFVARAIRQIREFNY